MVGQILPRLVTDDPDRNKMDAKERLVEQLKAREDEYSDALKIVFRVADRYQNQALHDAGIRLGMAVQTARCARRFIGDLNIPESTTG